MTEKQFGKGEVIFRQGDEGDSFYRVTEGCVDVFASYGDEDEVRLTQLGTGAFLGEMAVIESYPRSATAVAAVDGTKVMEMTADDINAFMENDPDKIIEIMYHLGHRLRDLTDDYKEVSALIDELKEGSGASKEKMSKFSRFFRENRKLAGRESSPYIMDAGSHARGVCMNVAVYRKGAVICREGLPGACMYDIHSGRVGIYTGYGTDDCKELAILYPDTFFGETAMICKENRSATAVALDENTTVEAIYIEDLRVLFEKNPPKADMILRHLSFRLRRLTDKYLKACALVCEAEENDDADEKTLARIREFMGNLYD